MREWLRLKNIKRTGWVRAGVDDAESVAAHSWGMSILAMHLCPPSLDKTKVMEMAIIHDLPEVIVGDLTPHDDTSNKAADEMKAMSELAPQWLELFSEYEAQESPEAVFVKRLDKLDMSLMAEIYQQDQGLDLSEFIASARPYLADMDLNHL